MTTKQGGFTGALAELIRQGIDYQLTEFHVCMPGKIESYNPKDGTATVKPTISRRFRGASEPIEYPVIPKVPVVQPRTNRAWINFPIEPGDLVLIVFADRNYENWLQSTGEEPKECRDVRRHDLSDAFAIIGGYPISAPAPPEFPGALNIELKLGTKIAVTNGTEELMGLISEILDYLTTTITVTNSGGATGAPTNAALLDAIKTRFETAFKV